jgi:hypothetical protein
MKVAVIYRSASEHGRPVTEFLRDFERRTGKKLEEIDPDSIRGANFCAVYDVVEYPTVIVTTDDGQLVNMWRGVPLPLIDEVSYYVQ